MRRTKSERVRHHARKEKINASKKRSTADADRWCPGCGLSHHLDCERRLDDLVPRHSRIAGFLLPPTQAEPLTRSLLRSVERALHMARPCPAFPGRTWTMSFAKSIPAGDKDCFPLAITSRCMEAILVLPP